MDTVQQEQNKGVDPLQNELVKMLSDVSDTKLISKLLLNMNNHDLTTLMNLLEFADIDTRKLWLDTYSKLIKY